MEVSGILALFTVWHWNFTSDEVLSPLWMHVGLTFGIFVASPAEFVFGKENIPRDYASYV